MHSYQFSTSYYISNITTLHHAISVILEFLFMFSRYSIYKNIHSFPTRRSSDLIMNTETPYANLFLCGNLNNNIGYFSVQGFLKFHQPYNANHTNTLHAM